MEFRGFKVLSYSEIEKIYEGAIKILSEVGFFIESKKALDYLFTMGVKVDKDKQYVFLSKKQIEDAIEFAPKKISFYKRTGQIQAELHKKNLYCTSGQTANYIIDIFSGNRREGILNDISDFTRLSDSLENITFITQAVVAHDVPGSATIVSAFKEMMINSSKPIGLNQDNGRSCKAVIEMAKLVLDTKTLKEKPFLFIETSPVSPLCWGTGAFDALVESVKENVPCVVMPCPIAGMSAPVSLMGYLTQHLAETLSGLVMGQMIKKGCPIVLAFVLLGFDMKENVATIATPETILCRTAAGQIGETLGIPTFTNGLDSDTHCFDEQTAYEKALTTVALMGSGSNFCCNAGLLSAGLTISLEQLVIDNEIFGICKHLLKGIQLTSSELSLDLITKVGPRGNYIQERQTLFDFKREYHLNKLSQPMSYERWKEKGGRTFVEIAHKKALELLSSHKPDPLPIGVEAKLTEFVENFINEVKE